ncbi:2-oxoglutarate dehydrogenase E1 component [Neobacillus mesonae]|uniref:2-oxoglutarate dehydrogenase E1 component n=1 Tax=Neobacillus mesonae TaxID=1193713 RepID=UPI002E1EB0C3|nr:2-oxoglutarate dehydrogenase E1 component [Neobacillus mesonae]MED4204043.1 2-oxoglutarate dehydrogenase E1 component [Neobacillus mesonae]
MRPNQDHKHYLNDFLGPNLGYLMDQFERFQQDPLSVDEEMRALFTDMNEADLYNLDTPTANEVNLAAVGNEKMFAAIKLADAIRTYGHLAADIYPLGNHQPDKTHIDFQSYGLSESDLRNLPAGIISKNSALANKSAYEAVEYLKQLYTNTITYEFEHVHDMNEKNWLVERIENADRQFHFSKEKKLKLLNRLMEVEEFEKFLHKTFVGQKRFSIEGLDIMVPLIDEIISRAVDGGADTINIGMAHRGRLNVLAHVLGKPYEMIFAEFQHAPNKELVPSEGSIGINFGWTGDVKYHLGLNRELKGVNEKTAKITLANNPSHLEFVGAVVEGYTRAAQDERNQPGYPKEGSDSALSILIHGDAAFPGEGIVAETLNLSRLRGYRTGGTIHIIANNMIGFTTESYDSRSTRYSSDLAKGFEIPIIHVNADDAESCIKAALIAAEYRAVFHKDILIDLIGYRRFGHNEMDEPMATNPKIYTLVQKHPTVKEIYEKNLLSKGIANEKEIGELQSAITQRLQEAQQKVAKVEKAEDLHIPDPPNFTDDQAAINTAVPLDTLKQMNQELLQWPNDFNVFHKLAKILKRRMNALEENGKVEWALAESLAFASILADGTPIRFTGQDTERGTFAQRNLVLHDEQTGETYLPLHHLSSAKASFAIYNSPLTETAVVGFEYGYNVFSPETLVIWEAQFGDFANAAQVIFDQFIAAGRAKWGQKSGLVMLLPHGYEGQGPEHSSARPERFLQTAAEKNWTVANVTSAAQYFHLLRRQAAQLLREEVRPLVLMSPKSLLRNPLVASTGSELSNGRFEPVLEQFTFSRDDSKVERIVMCSGKIAIDIAEQVKDGAGYDWLQVMRLEEIYPFPTDRVKQLFTKYPNVKEVFWLQEEPKNMGAWTFVEPRINEQTSNGITVQYIGRRRRSSPAEGEPNVHKLIQSKILAAALTRSDEGGNRNG